MRKRILSLLVLVATSQAMGCIIVSDDDDTGSVSVAWTTLSAGPDGVATPAACPSNIASAKLYAQLEGSITAFEEPVNCGDYEGIATDLPIGTYDVWVRFDDSSGNRVMESLSATVDVAADDTTAVPAFDIYVDRAMFRVSWSLGTGVSCESAGDVSILVTYGVQNVPAENLVPCADGIGESIPVPLGESYTIDVSLLNESNGKAIAAAPTIPASETGQLEWGNQVKVLDPVVIMLK